MSRYSIQKGLNFIVVIFNFTRSARCFFQILDSSSLSVSKGANLPADADVETSEDDEDQLPSIYEPLSYGRSTRATQRASTPPVEQRDFLDIVERSQMKNLSHRARFLMAGKEGMGQSTHLAPAVLHSMEHLKVYVLDLPSLYGVSARVPEEGCSQVSSLLSKYTRSPTIVII